MSANRRHRDSREIEAELDQTRARMSDTLDALQHKFTPGGLFNDAFSYFRARGGGELASHLGVAVKNNPMATTLVGIGLAWLAMSGSDESSRSYLDGVTGYGDPDDPYDVYAGDPEGMSAELTTQAYSDEPVDPLSSDRQADSEDMAASDEVLISEEVVVRSEGDEDPVAERTQDTTSGTRSVTRDEDETIVRRT